MTEVFADTFYSVALSNPRDAAHKRAVQFTASFQGRLTTTAWVMTEFANAMSHPSNRQEFVNMLRDLQANTSVTIVPPEMSLFEDGIKLFGARGDKSWSLTDCISFVVMQRSKILHALTGDRDFEQAGFISLLK